LTGWNIVFEAFAVDITVCGTVALLSLLDGAVSTDRNNFAETREIGVWDGRWHALAVVPTILRAVAFLCSFRNAVATYLRRYAVA
jgi:hypothetical protein